MKFYDFSVTSAKAFCVFSFLLIWVACEDQAGIRKIQARDVDDLKKQAPTDGPEGRAAHANDFTLIREPGSRPENHYHHHHDHHYGYFGPPGYNHDHYHGDFNRDVQMEDDIDIYLNSTGIPLDFVKNLNEYNVSDLLLNFVEDGPELIEKPVLYSRFGDSETADTERNAAQMARPAKCLPELTTVKIAESKNPNIFYIPECTRIERCGGCCSHNLLSCQPTETETVTLQVTKTEYTGGKKLKYVGKELVLVEKHTKCKCNCKVKAEDCNSYQEYREGECRCLCKNIDEEKKCYKKNSKKLWNPDVCACQCREVMPCSTGYNFDYNECRCVQSQVKRRYILPDVKKE